MKKIIESELAILKDQKKRAEHNVIDAVSRGKEPNETNKHNLIVLTANVDLLTKLLEHSNNKEI